MIGRLPLADQRRLGRQYRAAARQHLDAALAAGSATAAGGGHENTGIGEPLHELYTYRHLQLRVVVDHDGDAAGLH